MQEYVFFFGKIADHEDHHQVNRVDFVRVVIARCPTDADLTAEAMSYSLANDLGYTDPLDYLDTTSTGLQIRFDMIDPLRSSVC